MTDGALSLRFVQSVKFSVYPPVRSNKATPCVTWHFPPVPRLTVGHSRRSSLFCCRLGAGWGGAQSETFFETPCGGSSLAVSRRAFRSSGKRSSLGLAAVCSSASGIVALCAQFLFIAYNERKRRPSAEGRERKRVSEGGRSEEEQGSAGSGTITSTVCHISLALTGGIGEAAGTKRSEGQPPLPSKRVQSQHPNTIIHLQITAC